MLYITNLRKPLFVPKNTLLKWSLGRYIRSRTKAMEFSFLVYCLYLSSLWFGMMMMMMMNCSTRSKVVFVVSIRNSFLPASGDHSPTSSFMYPWFPSVLLTAVFGFICPLF
jgi:hypothetical protein